METVKQFNQELSSLYDIKPPISKAKMTSITKGAIRAIKYYKHVVQSVEKFIQKCRPEYKIPGLYVIDSIVRQSRHQFGVEKDVFANRFAKNIRVTFFHLYKCTEEEKSKIIRVLNLWQKNEVFPPDVVQPLFDLANPGSELSKQMDEQTKRSASGGAVGQEKGIKPALQIAAETQIHSKQPLSSDDQVEQRITQELQKIHQLLKTRGSSTNDNLKFNRKLLDFDYSDDEDGNDVEGRPSAALIEVIQTIVRNDRVLHKLKSRGDISDAQIQQMKLLLHQYQQPQGQVGPIFASQNNSSPSKNIQSQGFGQFGPLYLTQDTSQSSNTDLWGALQSQSIAVENEVEDEVQIIDEHGPPAGTWRRRSRSPSDSRRGRRSRSRSRDRSSRRKRSRSPPLRETDRDREKVREREKKGLPPLKKNHLSVCSTTLWVGHLSKLVGNEDLSDTFGEYGTINSINLIPPRGCAFICMNRRQDASKALKALNKRKIQGKQITIAWAPGKCMKEKQWKDYWDVDIGVSYIPYAKIDQSVNLIDLEDGGMLDDDSIPEWMQPLRDAGQQPIHLHQQSQPKTFTETSGFVRLPEGISPVLGGHNEGLPLSVPGAPPPGLSHFALPPALAAQASLLQGAPMLQGGASILQPGVPRFVGPAGLILPRYDVGQPPPLLAQPPPVGTQPLVTQPPPLTGSLPPGFPNFDISQPPPGIRPFQPMKHPIQGVDDMEIDHESSTNAFPHNNDRHERERERDRNYDRTKERDKNRDRGRDRDRERDRDRSRTRGRHSRWSQDNSSDDRPDHNEPLLSRLRMLAGHEEAGSVENIDVHKNFGIPIPNRENQMTGPPPFGGIPFAGNQFPNLNGDKVHGSSFRNAPPVPQMGDSPFGDFRGGRGSPWRGRGGRGAPSMRGFRPAPWLENHSRPDVDAFTNDRDGHFHARGRGGRGRWQGQNDKTLESSDRFAPDKRGVSGFKNRLKRHGDAERDEDSEDNKETRREKRSRWSSENTTEALNGTEPEEATTKNNENHQGSAEQIESDFKDQTESLSVLEPQLAEADTSDSADRLEEASDGIDAFEGGLAASSLDCTSEDNQEYEGTSNNVETDEQQDHVLEEFRDADVPTARDLVEPNHPEDYSQCDQDKSSPQQTEGFNPQIQIIACEVLKSDEDRDMALDN